MTFPAYNHTFSNIGITCMNLIFMLLILAFASCKEKAKPQLSQADSDKLFLLSLKETCQDNIHCYKEHAITDFQKENLVLFHNGMLTSCSFMEFYCACVEASKSINIIDAGCVDDTFIGYYNDAMIQQIQNKYGNAYLDSCRIDSELKSGKKGYLKDNIWQR